MIDLLPWHRQPLRELLARRGRMPHALLIHGNQGIGKVEFAKAIAQSLLCEANEDGIACGKCAACGWFRDGNHPDFRVLLPDILAEETTDTETVAEDADKKEDKKSKEIRIDQIRAIGGVHDLANQYTTVPPPLSHTSLPPHPKHGTGLLTTLHKSPARPLIPIV